MTKKYKVRITLPARTVEAGEISCQGMQEIREGGGVRVVFKKKCSLGGEATTNLTPDEGQDVTKEEVSLSSEAYVSSPPSETRRDGRRVRRVKASLSPSPRSWRQSGVRRGAKGRIFTLEDSAEEGAREKREAALAIGRVLSEWEGGAGKASKRKIPKELEDLVRFHCADYERRAESLRKSRREREGARHFAHRASLSPAARGGEETDSDRVTRGGAETDSDRVTRGEGARMRLAIRRKGGLPETVLSHYRHLNDMIDLGLESACEPGVRAEMRADIAEGRGERRTMLYFLDRRTYRKSKRRAKLAIAAALGLL